MKKRIIAMVLCIVMCLCIFPINAFAASRDTSFEESLASRLKALGLFKGVSDTDFDLNRAPTRVEALVMLIRTLGQEDEALDGNWKHPFKDVPQWADKYVGYAYEKGLTNGVSSTQFGTDNATAATYLTFVLRALGYSDTNNQDFSWKDPFTLAKSIGILPSAVNTSNFWRADAVMISYAALPVKLKGASETLAQKLITAEVFSETKYETYYDADAFNTRNQSSSSGTLSAEDIYRKCSPMVFNIETWDIGGYKIGSGTGFLIGSNGAAVTSIEVLKNAHRAVATMADGREYEITGLAVYDPYYDYALIKLEGSGFPAMTVGDSSKVKSGDTVYEIGSPLSGSTAASEGIVLNPEALNEDVGYEYIATTVPISMGNNGGVLVNAKGEVIGVSTYFHSKRQNISVAVPINEAVLEAIRWKFRGATFSLEEALRRIRTFEESAFSGTLADVAAGYEIFCCECGLNNNGYFYSYEDEREPNDWPDSQMWIDNLTVVYGELSGSDSDTFRVCYNNKGEVDVKLTVSSKGILEKINIRLFTESGEEIPLPQGVNGEIEETEDGKYRIHLGWWKESGESLDPGIYYIVISLDESIQSQNTTVEYKLFSYIYPDGLDD